MDAVGRETVVVGQVARAELCPCGSSMVLSVGALSLRLDLFAAHDVAETLRQFLAGVASAEAPAETGSN